MNKYKRIAYAGVVKEEDKDSFPYDKVGSGIIDLRYEDAYYCYGGILVTKSGSLSFYLEENASDTLLNYMYDDYLQIDSGKTRKKSHFFFIDKPDQNRWINMKKFIVDNNITMKYDEDIELDYELNDKEIKRENEETENIDVKKM